MRGGTPDDDTAFVRSGSRLETELFDLMDQQLRSSPPGLPRCRPAAWNCCRDSTNALLRTPDSTIAARTAIVDRRHAAIGYTHTFSLHGSRREKQAASEEPSETGSMKGSFYLLKLSSSADPYPNRTAPRKGRPGT
ncbi:hypothetical protein GCM10009678_67710 [Actinomadura kijaniata]